MAAMADMPVGVDFGGSGIKAAPVDLDRGDSAPMKATRDMFIRDGKADTSLSQTGALASGVPGSVAVYEQLVAKHGKKKLAELILPAAEMAEKGFVVTETYAERLRLTRNDLALFEGSRRVLLKSSGEPYAKGEVLKQPDLANSYRSIAREGAGWFSWKRGVGGTRRRGDEEKRQ